MTAVTNNDDHTLSALIPSAVAYVLRAAEGWPSWDGEPIRHGDTAADEWTPHKALRRVADHLTDHLAELEARLAGENPRPDQWAGRTVTTAADRALFSEGDLREAHQRLPRLADIWRLRLAALDAGVLDHRPDPETWTLRQVVEHVANATRAYADAMRPAEASAS